MHKKGLPKIMIFPSFIAVEGPDGAGKSTFIDLLKEEIQKKLPSRYSDVGVTHFRPSILPNLGAIAEKTKIVEVDKDFTSPHRAKPVGFFCSLFRMGYYWMDYLIGVPLGLMHAKFVIYDRYIYDFLIDPKRSRISLPYVLRKLFSRCVLQPSIVFILVADPQIIYARKKELEMDEIGRQIGELKILASTHDRFIILEATKTPRELVNEAINILERKGCLN